MSYPTYPLYGAYQPTTTTTTTTGAYVPYQSMHYPSLYPQAAQSSYQPFLSQLPPRFSPPPECPAPPDLPSVTPQIASKVVERLLAVVLRDAGFDSAQRGALKRLELEVVALVDRLYESAHNSANLANRDGPIVKDLTLACQHANIQTKDLYAISKNYSKKRKRGSSKGVAPSALVPPPARSPSPELLPSDDEDQPLIPTTLRGQLQYMPRLPPKHTYLRTPPSPPKKAALPSLEKKLKTAGLVQKSLKNLLLATEDMEGHEDGELLGHIVNWEAGIHPRKRWKVGGS